MQLVSLWKESFSQFLPANLSVLVYLYARTLWYMVRQFIKNYWWVLVVELIILNIIFYVGVVQVTPDFLGFIGRVWGEEAKGCLADKGWVHWNYVDLFSMASFIFIFLLVWVFILAVRASVEKKQGKDLYYSLGKFLVWTVSAITLVIPAIGFSFLFYFLRIDSDRLIIQLFMTLLVGLIWSWILIMAFLLLDSHLYLVNFLGHYLRVLKMSFASFPLLFLGGVWVFLVGRGCRLLFSYGSLFFTNIGAKFIGCWVEVFSYFFSFLLGFILLLPWLAVIYTKQIHEHYSYYFKQ